MKTGCFILFIGIVFTVSIGCDTPQQKGSHAEAKEKNKENFDDKVIEKEAHFVANAIEDQYAEIKLAELASTKSSNKEIQDFAQQLVEDHTNALAMFRALAERKGVAVPVDEGEEAKKRVNKLSTHEGQDFDKKWCDEIVSLHKKSIREFESMYDKSRDTELLELINHTLMDLHAQRDRLHSLKDKIM
jgi:putative membrane protein